MVLALRRGLGFVSHPNVFFFTTASWGPRHPWTMPTASSSVPISQTIGTHVYTLTFIKGTGLFSGFFRAHTLCGNHGSRRTDSYKPGCAGKFFRRCKLCLYRNHGRQSFHQNSTLQDLNACRDSFTGASDAFQSPFRESSVCDNLHPQNDRCKF